ncbi:alpha-2,8-sialyltransferase 8F-like [Solea senegalensis]|uniref:Alpha-2,8-sialyltransferase 8F-like n=1 Tax=Solea senegalensis TaxID=28829 RepID=A0AAV6RIL1_SOLSE|nr:alpha-2,8-sialyltransferase 8F isoform X1 [Solea senegalensis]KAG7504147.1 alpha-2,8-sialyltransferase 8F-like [Solea senegalensis]
MRGHLLKSFFSWMFTLVCVGSLLTTVIWYVFNDNNVDPRRPTPHRTERHLVPQSADICKGCGEIITKVVERYSQTWKRQEDNYKKFRSQLSSKCHGFHKAVITQANTPVGSKLVYDGEKKRTLQVTPEIFSTFTKEHPFSNKTWDTCAVVGNGGILSNSSCGQMIDSAQFVMRCNLPPLANGYEKHVGIKTDLVTANPSIFVEKYGALMGRRRPFAESLRSYGNSLLLLPAFSYGHNTPLSMRAVYTIEDFESPTRPIFFNPEYLQSLAAFWRSQGLRAVRLSTGIIMASMALEVCTNVHLYGFWPFANHPHGFRALTNHYYDDRQTKKKFHAMPAEFDLLLRLHSQGVLRLHLGDCQAGEK